MKKNLCYFMLLLLTIGTAKAQWTKDASVNTLIASGSDEYSEIYVSTCESTGDTYVQWSNMQTGQWVPNLQRLNIRGEKQWGDDGILIFGNTGSSMSYGMAMVATSDGNAVSLFRVQSTAEEGIAFKISPEGEQLWGASGLKVFSSCVRTELVAGNDGGVWAVCYDWSNVQARYIHSDGTMGELITISDNEGKVVSFPKPVIDNENNIFIVYQKEFSSSGTYESKEIYVEKYAPDGTQLHGTELLMQTVDGILFTLDVYAIPDGIGGGYAWMWHHYTNFYEVYAFHFNSEGVNTMPTTYGTTISVPDGINFHFYADAVVEPSTNDAIFVFREVDASSQSQNAIKATRISQTGDKVWGAGEIVLVPTTAEPLSDIIIDEFPDGSGAVVIYKTGNYGASTIKAIGIDNLGEVLWNTDLSTSESEKSMVEETTGFHNGQLILAWGNEGETYSCQGQNLQPDGTLGIVNVGVPENKASNIKMYPNPVEDILNIEAKNMTNIIIYNSLGQVVKEIEVNGDNVSLSLENLVNGLYLIKVFSEGRDFVERILVE